MVKWDDTHTPKHCLQLVWQNGNFLIRGGGVMDKKNGRFRTTTVTEGATVSGISARV